MDPRTIQKTFWRRLALGLLLLGLANYAGAIVRYPASAGLGIGSVTGTHLLDGTITGNDISRAASTTIFRLQVSDLMATSTTATSTFAGGLAVDTDTLFVDPYTNRVGINDNSPTSALSFGQVTDSSPSSFANHLALWGNVYGIGITTNQLNYVTGGAHVFMAGAAERARFATNTGNLGIGTTSPYAKLSVVGETVSTYFTATSTTATSTFYGGVKLGTTGNGLEFPDGTIQTTSGNSVVVFTPSTSVQTSANTERSTTSGTAVKLKEIRVNRAGKITTSFDLKDSVVGGSTAEGIVYKNGVAVGTTRSVNDTIYATFTENIAVETADLVQLYALANPGETAFVRNFRLSYDQVATTTSAVYLD